MKYYIDYCTTKKNGLHWILYRHVRYAICQILLFLLHPTRPKEKEHTISICAIFKNEGPFLKEWIEYHLLIGIDHFYLYNNFSDDNYIEVLQPYIEKGIVTLIDWPIDGGQLPAYKHCYDNFKNETNWIAFIDLDEFICLSNENDIRNWIKRYYKYPTVFIHWRMFMCSGIIEREQRSLVTETNTQCWPLQNNSGKSIVNTSYRFSEIGCHQSFPLLNFMGIRTTLYPVNEYKRFFTHWRSRGGKESSIQLNHYYYRSYNQYVYKSFVRGDAISPKSGAIRTKEGFFEKMEQMATTKDFTIQRFLTRLKVKMNPSEVVDIPMQ